MRSGTGGLLVWLVAACALGACSRESAPQGRDDVRGASGAGARVVLDLSGPGWTLTLDPAAPWEDDALHLPGVDLASLPARPPTDGWAALDSGLPVSVPGTVEEHLWPKLGDVRGVSWWSRTIEVPAAALEAAPEGGPGRRALLRFQAVRLRAEVFLDERLVGYDAVGNTPFDVDLTDALRPGPHRLAVRVTDPGGNFDWKDHDAHAWGTREGAPTIPASHGFGGVTGPVRLELVDPVFLADVWVRNGLVADEADVVVTVRNTLGEPVTGALHLELLDARGVALPYDAWRIAREMPPGESVHELELRVPGATTWSLQAPTLHVARVALHRGEGALRLAGGTDDAAPRALADLGPPQDVVERRFGFRSFTVQGVEQGVGEDARFVLNGRRIVLRSAISWGFWPTSGMVPTPALARRQVETAKALGLNMLNHHRTIAAPGLLDVHDELGLLAYCEPGGYASVGGDELCRALAREKLLRMVRRDRGHPSVVIWNMINEETAAPTDAQRQDLADAHALDPSRPITFTSGWSSRYGADTDLYALPFETEPRTTGWWDDHEAPGPGVVRDEHWNGPTDHECLSETRDAIVFWGEQGAIASPPRLALIAREVDPAHPGWDGEAYLAWHDGYARYLREKGLAGAFPDVDALTRALGAIAHEHQARTIENVRLGDVTDGYVVNGWDGEILENHSGIVDAWRHPKAPVDRLARANAPLRLVVRLRRSIGQASDWLSPSVRNAVGTVADVGLIDETGRTGPHVLLVSARDARGAELWSLRKDVVLPDDGRYGRMLAAGLAVTVEADAGTYAVRAALHEPPAGGGDGVGPLVAQDEEPWWLVDWRTQAMPANGALLETGRALRRFYEEHGKGSLPVFHDGLPPVDFVLVGDYDPEPRDPVPAEAFGDGLRGRYARGRVPPGAPGDAGGPAPLLERTDATLDFEWTREGPDPALGTGAYAVRWDGTLTSTQSGEHVLHLASAGGARAWLDGALVIDAWEAHDPAYARSPPLALEAGRAHALAVEYRRDEGAALLKLFWTPPERRARVAGLLDELLRRAREDGATLAFLDRADVWAEQLAARGVLTYDGKLEHGRYWMGGGFFACASHPILRGLPAGVALGRPYQELVNYVRQRSGLYLQGEEVVIGCVSDHQSDPATALGIVRVGKGRILLSTLDLLRPLNAPPGPAEVVRKLFCNLVAWAGTPEPAR